MNKKILSNKCLAALLAMTAFSGSLVAGAPAEAEPCETDKQWVNSAAKNVKNGAMNKLAELAAKRLAEK